MERDRDDGSFDDDLMWLLEQNRKQNPSRGRGFIALLIIISLLTIVASLLHQ